MAHSSFFLKEKEAFAYEKAMLGILKLKTLRSISYFLFQIGQDLFQSPDRRVQHPPVHHSISA
jgi:hypothetical protein